MHAALFPRHVVHALEGWPHLLVQLVSLHAHWPAHSMNELHGPSDAEHSSVMLAQLEEMQLVQASLPLPPNGHETPSPEFPVSSLELLLHAASESNNKLEKSDAREKVAFIVVSKGSTPRGESHRRGRVRIDSDLRDDPWGRHRAASRDLFSPRAAQRARDAAPAAVSAGTPSSFVWTKKSQRALHVTDPARRRQEEGTMPKMTRYFVAALLSLLALDVAACSAESDLGSRLDGGSPPDGPGRILPDAGDGRGNVDKDGVPRDGRVSAENDTCQPTNDAAPPRDANANNDAGAICRGTPFRQALVIAMPSAYTVAGFSFAPWYRELQEFDFATQQDPRRISHHASNDFTSGNLRIKDEERIYQPEERISAVARDKRISEVTWSTGTKEYVVRVGSDANLHDETFNLPTLGPSSVMTTLSRWVAGSTGREDGHLVRNGAEVYQKDELGSGNVWSVIANLAGSGTTNWEGLAATSEETSGAYILFTKARTTGGQSGIIEQRWPNALPGSAGPATVVVANADAAPFGVSDDGCELYASRKNGSTLEVVIFRR